MQFDHFAIDNRGTPWIVYKRNDGQRWALGLIDRLPKMVYLGEDGKLQLDLSKPNAFRELSAI